MKCLEFVQRIFVFCVKIKIVRNVLRLVSNCRSGYVMMIYVKKNHIFNKPIFR